MYKFEMHLHSSGCSACARSTAVELAEKALEKGYSGIVFTNHFYHGNTCVDRSLPWKDFVDAYRQDYLQAKAWGDAHGLVVLFGIEEGYGGAKEILIYGIEAEQVMNAPEFRDMNVYQMSDFIHEKGGYVACAHPFRARAYIPNPDVEPDPAFMDAVEVFNLGNTAEMDAKAAAFAEKHHLPGISGGDVHITDMFGYSGLDFDNPVTSNRELVEALRAGAYKRIESTNREVRKDNRPAAQ